MDWDALRERLFALWSPGVPDPSGEGLPSGRHVATVLLRSYIKERGTRYDLVRPTENPRLDERIHAVCAAAGLFRRVGDPASPLGEARRWRLVITDGALAIEDAEG